MYSVVWFEEETHAIEQVCARGGACGYELQNEQISIHTEPRALTREGSITVEYCDSRLSRAHAGEPAADGVALPAPRSSQPAATAGGLPASTFFDRTQRAATG